MASGVAGNTANAYTLTYNASAFTPSNGNPNVAIGVIPSITGVMQPFSTDIASYAISTMSVTVEPIISLT